MGIPEIHLPMIDPYYIPQIEFKTGEGTSVSVNIIYRDVLIFGASNFEILDVKVDLDKPQLEMEYGFPEIAIRANYTAQGRVLVLPINGHGIGQANVSK